MANTDLLQTFSKDELIELIGLYSKNWLAMDGVWFQSVERKFGMEEAMFHDVEIWKRFTVTEARRIKAFLKLGEHPGLEGLAKALRLRFYGNINDDEIRLVYEDGRSFLCEGDEFPDPGLRTPAAEQPASREAAETPHSSPAARRLIYTMVDCRVQTARAKKGMEFHPCKPVGEVEYSGFAREIDDRISCRCISCYPEITDQTCCCKWEFWIAD